MNNLGDKNEIKPRARHMVIYYIKSSPETPYAGYTQLRGTKEEIIQKMAICGFIVTSISKEVTGRSITYSMAGSPSKVCEGVTILEGTEGEVRAQMASNGMALLSMGEY